MTHPNPSFSAGDMPAQMSPIAHFWNDVLAPKFITYRHILVGGLARHSAAVLPTLDVKAGDTVLDVGCGFGDSALDLAKRVGERGHVTGVDCCEAFLDLAREEAMRARASNVDFIYADAEAHLPKAGYDFVFARFGTMFFVNPVAGLRNMNNALRPGGTMTHIVWDARENNPWLAAARDVLLEHLPQPDANAPSCGPGPFSMANPDVLELQMRAAGCQDITFKRVEQKVLVGRDIEEAIAFQLAIGPAGEIFRLGGAEAEAKRSQIENDLCELFERFEKDEHGIWMDSASWIVTSKSNAA